MWSNNNYTEASTRFISIVLLQITLFYWFLTWNFGNWGNRWESCGKDMVVSLSSVSLQYLQNYTQL